MDFSGYSNPTVEENLAQADATADDAARADLVIAAEKQLATDLPIIRSCSRARSSSRTPA